MRCFIKSLFCQSSIILNLYKTLPLYFLSLFFACVWRRMLKMLDNENILHSFFIILYWIRFLFFTNFVWTCPFLCETRDLNNTASHTSRPPPYQIARITPSMICVHITPRVQEIPLFHSQINSESIVASTPQDSETDRQDWRHQQEARIRLWLPKNTQDVAIPLLKNCQSIIV